VRAITVRNLGPLPAGIDHTVAAALPISGLTAWQALFDHARLRTGQTVLIHGAAGGGAVRLLAEAPAAFAPGHRVPGKTIIQVTPGG
jgi:NADPH:quinone reductase-like Zn-dependent oxidoreductase